jgi:SAM-dependent methyltransferase
MNGPFHNFPEEYDLWYERNQPAYASELECIQRIFPSSGRGLEVGVGTGRFAAPLKVGWGIDPEPEMLARARSRGVRVIRGRGEELPFADGIFNYVLLVVTLCFVEEPRRLLAEAGRVLGREGEVIVGMVDKDSFLGKMYQAKKNESKFYRGADFFSVPEIMEMLPDEEWEEIKVFQTVFDFPKDIGNIQTPRPGYGEGGFVVISARKRAG